MTIAIQHSTKVNPLEFCFDFLNKFFKIILLCSITARRNLPDG